MTIGLLRYTATPRPLAARLLVHKIRRDSVQESKRSHALRRKRAACRVQTASSSYTLDSVIHVQIAVTKAKMHESNDCLDSFFSVTERLEGGASLRCCVHIYTSTCHSSVLSSLLQHRETSIRCQTCSTVGKSLYNDDIMDDDRVQGIATHHWGPQLLLASDPRRDPF